MHTILNFSKDKFFEMGLNYIFEEFSKSNKLTQNSFVVLIGQECPMSALLQLRKLNASSKIIIILDHLCSRFASTIIGNNVSVLVVPECIPPRKISSLLALPLLFKYRRPIHFSGREVFLLMEFKKHQSNSLTLTAKNSNLNIKTLSVHKRNILKK